MRKFYISMKTKKIFRNELDITLINNVVRERHGARF